MVAPGRPYRGSTHVGGAGYVIAPRKYAFVIDGNEAKVSNLRDPLIELGSIEVAGGSDDGEAVALAKGMWLEH
jgi:hypothetical protein